MSSIINIKSGIISYGKSPVLEVTDININEGKLYQIRGDNGSGKSSFFRCILNYKTNFTGSIFLKNQLINNLTTEEILSKGIRLVPQERNVFDRLTIEEHIKVIYKGNNFSFENRGIINYLGPSKQKGLHLSGGQAKLLITTFVLSQQPFVLLLDEPFAGLDPNAQKLLEVLLQSLLLKNICIIISDHTNYSIKYHEKYKIINNKFFYKLIKDE
ncbi:MAG: ATP-binding cassette domain-containing protein [Ignavibacteriae bacterium]|nr:MAG: ATP-binding cassette domain-containing protein [Ignavibacteriota bacterium]